MACAGEPTGAEVVSFLEDYATLARRRAIQPAALRRRLRRLGISAIQIAACTGRADLLELLLFADLPHAYSWRGECIALLLIIVALMWLARGTALAG